MGNLLVINFWWGLLPADSGNRFGDITGKGIHVEYVCRIINRPYFGILLSDILLPSSVTEEPFIQTI